MTHQPSATSSFISPKTQTSRPQRLRPYIYMASRSAATLRRKTRLGRCIREAVADYPDEVESKHIVECFSAGDFLNCLFSANYLSRRQIISVDGKLARCEACLLLFRRRRCLPKSHCNTFSCALVAGWCFAVVRGVGSPHRWFHDTDTPLLT